MKSKEILWTSQSGLPAPITSHASEFKNPDLTVIANGETLERYPQKWGQATVENSFLTKIYDRTGKLIFVKSQYADENWDKLEKKIAELDTKKYLFLENQKKINPQLHLASRIFDPQVVLTTKYGAKHPLYQVDYIDASQSGVFRMKISPFGTVLITEKVSSAFEQGHAFIFPEGPKLSALTEVVLAQLVGDGTLTKTSYKVVSQAPEKAVSTDEFFKYEPSDSRFDQVQTFYFVDRALRFFQDQLGVVIPFFIEVQTDVGSPDKTNAMFYYHGQVRLGAGDGISYANIMKDPSIVTHETCHALIEVLSNLPMGQGEGGSINEAFADFFTTSFLDNPNLAEVAFIKGPYKRSVNNTMKLSEKNGGLYHDSLIVSGTLYEIKKELGAKLAQDLAVKTLMRMGSSGNFGNLKQNILMALAQGFSDSQKKTVLDVLTERGW